MKTMTEPQPKPQRRPRSHKGEPAPYHRPDGRWSLTVEMPARAGRRQRRSVYGGSRADVVAKAKRLRADLAIGLMPADEKTPLADYLHVWNEERKPGKPRAIAPRTWYSYDYEIRRRIVPYLGKTAIGKLRVAIIQRWVDEMAAAGTGARSVELAHAILRTALADAVRSDIIPRNPAVGVRITSPRRNLPEPWTEGHCRTFLSGILTDPDRVLYMVSATCGLRPGEVLALRWSSLDLAAGVVRVDAGLTAWEGERYLKETKSEAGNRTLPLAPVVVTALIAHRDRQKEVRTAIGDKWRDNDLVFAGPTGGPRRTDTLSHQFSSKIAILGLPHIRLYDLRRLAGTLVLTITKDLHAARAFLGHSSIALTSDLYGYLLPSVSGPASQAIADMVVERMTVSLAVSDQNDAADEPDLSTKRP
jgi:integrase